MPILYESTPWDFHTEGPSLTEQEHADSCDINKMISNALRGMDVRGGGTGVYGYDDTTMDAITHRIRKAQLEEDLANGQKEFTQAELDLIPVSVQKKFGFQLKKEPTRQQNVTNDDLNDDNTNKNGSSGSPKQDPPTTPPPQPK